jgi:DNA-binding response OmpR family regulator
MMMDLAHSQPAASTKGRNEWTLRAGALELDLIERRASYSGLEVPLTTTECRLLALMMRNPSVVMTRTIIFEMVWRYRFDPGSNTVDVHIGHLRKRLSTIGVPKCWLKTVRGAGYSIDPGL